MQCNIADAGMAYKSSGEMKFALGGTYDDFS